MTLQERVESAVSTAWPRIEAKDGLVQVPTTCLYPSNSIVTVFVEPKMDGFIVHDDGRALDEFEASSLTVGEPRRVLSQAVRKTGLTVSSAGAIVSRRLQFDEVPGAIAIVANASRDAARYLLDHARAPKRNFRGSLESELDRRFPNLWKRDTRVPGESTKLHRFDYSVDLPGERTLLVDAVVPDASSINSAVVASLDVTQARNHQIELRIVYDDHVRWTSADLSLLRVGARTVPFSSFPQTLAAVAA